MRLNLQLIKRASSTRNIKTWNNIQIYEDEHAAIVYSDDIRERFQTVELPYQC